MGTISSFKATKKKSRFDGSSVVDNYKLLESLAGGMEPKRPELSVILDEAVKERIFQSDAAFQSSSSNYDSKMLSGSKFSDLCPGESFNPSIPMSSKAATERKNEPISIILDEDNDCSWAMVTNEIADAEGSSGDQIHEHEITSQKKESVVVHPEYLTYGRNCYRKAKLIFLSGSIKLSVSEEEEPMGSRSSEWKTMDLISIESRWLDPLNRADVCLYIKPEHPKLATSGQKSGILEVKFTVCDPCWSWTQECIKSLDEQYKENWDVDLDSYGSFEDVPYVEGSCGSISISKSDLQVLQPVRFINDTIVDFYIEYLKKKMKPTDERIHFFNSFFFRKLADFGENQLRTSDTKEAFQQVRKWTKKVNIFQKDYIFIPVNFSLHWSLIVICHPGEVVDFEDEELATSLKVPCILHMDSVKGSHRGLEYIIRCYLWEEWKERSGDTAEDIFTKFMNLRFLRLEVPQQQNSYDCGLFMLHYIELFVKQAPINFNPVRSFISQDWFYPTEASLKRTRIKRLIFELTESQQVSSPSCSDKRSSEVKDVNEEAEVEFLHETYNSKETCCGSNCDTCVNKSGDVTPTMAKPLRSEPYLRSEIPCVNDEPMDINLLNEDTTSSSLEIQPHHESPETGDNEQSSIADIEQNHRQLVLHDPSNIVSSPIKGSDEIEDVLGNQVAVTGRPLIDAETKKIDSSVTCIDKSLNCLQLKEYDASERVSGCSSSSREALVVEDSDECSSSSSDDVFETCVVEDSDSDEVGEYAACYREKFASCEQKASSSIKEDHLNVQASKRRQPVASKSRKRLRRNSSDDLQVISLCE